MSDDPPAVTLSREEITLIRDLMNRLLEAIDAAELQALADEPAATETRQ